MACTENRVRHLCAGVHTGIGSPGAINADRPTHYLPQRCLNHLLDGSSVQLLLPTGIFRAIVGNRELVVMLPLNSHPSSLVIHIHRMGVQITLEHQLRSKLIDFLFAVLASDIAFNQDARRLRRRQPLVPPEHR